MCHVLLLLRDRHLVQLMISYEPMHISLPLGTVQQSY